MGTTETGPDPALRGARKALRAEKWLFGSNPRLRNRRPIDVIRAGETQELLPVLRQERAGSYA